MLFGEATLFDYSYAEIVDDHYTVVVCALIALTNGIDKYTCLQQREYSTA